MYQLTKKVVKTVFIYFVFCIWYVCAQGQSLNVYSVITEQLPIVSASISIRNTTNEQISSVNPTNIRVIENGVQRSVRLIQCPEGHIPERISSVLVMDISGSMAMYEPTNMALAKIAGKWWVDALPNDGSECAVTSFDHDSYINQDFTNNKQKLISALANLNPNGSTNYNSAFINGVGAGLRIINRAKYKKILILLTDGQGNIDPDAVLQKAQEEQTTVYCVGVRFSLPDALKNIAEKTQGLWFDNVLSATQLVDAYRNIYDVAINNKPCAIEWETDVSCNTAREAIISYIPFAVTDTLSYIIPEQHLPKISFSELIVKFTNEPGKTDSKDVEVTALSNNVEINSVIVNNPAFSIVPTVAFPWKLNKGDKRIFTVTFAPQDSSLTFDQIMLQGNICKKSLLYATGGFAGKRKKELQITVKRPNGGEIFVTGDTTTLEWSGVMPTDTVRLDYSTDNGITWLPVINKATGFSYLWKVPFTPSTQCLLRAQLLNVKTPDSVVFLMGHRRDVYEGCFSPDGIRAATVGRDSTLRIWDSFTGNEIQSPIIPFINRRQILAPQTVSWSNTITHIAVAGKNGAALFESDTYSQTDQFASAALKNCISGFFTPDGLSYIANGENNKIIISSVQQINKFSEVPTSHTAPIRRITIADFRKEADKHSFKILTSSEDNSACETQVNILHNDYSSTSNRVCHPLFTGGDSKVAYIQHPKNNEQLVASINGRIIRYSDGSVFSFPSNINDIEYSPDGKNIAVAFNSGELAILNAETMTIERKVDRVQATANTVRWDTFGSRILATYTNGTALVWSIKDVVLQEDISDNVWSITAPQITAITSIDMGTLYVDDTKDSLCNNVVCMTPIPQYTAKLDSANIINDTENNFRLVSGNQGIFPAVNPACRSIELQFNPTSAGIKNSILRCFIGIQSFDIPLRGIAIEKNIQLSNTLIDFGKVPVGTSKDSLLSPSVKNISFSQVDILSTRIPDIGKEIFSLIDGDTVIALQPQEFQSLKIRFSPKDIGRISSRIRVNFIGEGPKVDKNYTYITLLGEGICGETDSSKPLSISPGETTVSVMTGRRVNIPIVVSYDNVKNEEIPQEFFGRVSFNASLLYPRIGTPMGVVDKVTGRRSIEFKGSRNNNDTLMVFSFLTLFGDNDRTDFTIDTLFFYDGCPFIIRSDSLSIVFSDICDAGGKRLLTNAVRTNVSLREIRNDDNIAVFTVSLTEAAYPELLVCNMFGDIVLRKNIGYYESGEYEYSLLLPSLASGKYCVVLRTRNESVVATFMKW